MSTPAVTAETSIGNKVSKPREAIIDYSKLLKFVTQLTIEQKAELCKEIKRQLAGEVDALENKAVAAGTDFKQAQELIKGL